MSMHAQELKILGSAPACPLLAQPIRQGTHVVSTLKPASFCSRTKRVPTSWLQPPAFSRVLVEEIIPGYQPVQLVTSVRKRKTRFTSPLTRAVESARTTSVLALLDACQV